MYGLPQRFCLDGRETEQVSLPKQLEYALVCRGTVESHSVEQVEIAGEPVELWEIGTVPHNVESNVREFTRQRWERA